MALHFYPAAKFNKVPEAFVHVLPISSAESMSQQIPATGCLQGFLADVCQEEQKGLGCQPSVISPIEKQLTNFLRLGIKLFPL